LAAARAQLVDQAETIGRLTAEFAVAHAQLTALEPGQVAGGDAGTPASDRPRPWWRRWGWWRH